MDPGVLLAEVRTGKRAALARAITWIESQRADHREAARRLLQGALPYAGASIRVGITGSPGVGKSTLIEVLGTKLVAQGHRLAVLAVDPSSATSGGSILGDKTRMPKLATDPRAFVRPSPSGGALGGVGQRTRESMILCEAAGYDVIVVETVGVGQSETTVADMVDAFVVLLQPGAGDELQGMKRGVLELADLVVVNQADGDRLELARRSHAAYAQSLQLLRPRTPGWPVPVLLCSARTGEGIDALWSRVLEFRDAMQASGAWEVRRVDQRVHWLWQAIDVGLRDRFRRDREVVAVLGEIEASVRAGTITPDEAAARLLEAFRGAP